MSRVLRLEEARDEAVAWLSSLPLRVRTTGRSKKRAAGAGVKESGFMWSGRWRPWWNGGFAGGGASDGDETDGQHVERQMEQCRDVRASARAGRFSARMFVLVIDSLVEAQSDDDGGALAGAGNWGCVAAFRLSRCFISEADAGERSCRRLLVCGDLHAAGYGISAWLFLTPQPYPLFEQARGRDEG